MAYTAYTSRMSVNDGLESMYVVVPPYVASFPLLPARTQENMGKFQL
jgi:hypothetical protein